MPKTNKLFNLIGSQKNNSADLLRLLQPENINHSLKGNTKETVINELLDLLETNGKLFNRAAALKDIMDREKIMSTAIPNGVSLPRAKTNAVQDLTIAIGIKKSGVDFDSPFDDKTNVIVLALAPPGKTKPLYKFILAITAALNDDTLRSNILTAKTTDKIVELLRQYK